MQQRPTAATEAVSQAPGVVPSPGDIVNQDNKRSESKPESSNDVATAANRNALEQIELRIAQSRTPSEAAKWAVIRETYMRQNESVEQSAATRKQAIAEIVLKFGVTGGLAVLGGYMALHSLVLPGLAIIGGSIALISIEAGKQFFSVFTKMYKGDS
jgi:hypothetical protein